MAKKKAMVLEKGFDYNLSRSENRAFRYRKMVNGHQYEVCGASPAECKEKMEQEIRDVQEGFKRRENPTLGEWMRIYLTEYVAAEVKAKAKDTAKFQSTLANYETTARRHIIDTEIGKIKLKELQERDLFSHFHSRFLEKPAITKNALWLCKKALHRAFKNRIIRDNPAEDITLPKNNILRKAKKPTDGVVDLIREILRRFNIVDDDLVLYYELGFRLGMRKGELLGLPISAIDLQNMTIHIEQQLTKTNPLAKNLDGTDIEDRGDKYRTSILKTTKTEGSNRVIPIPSCLKEKLAVKIAKTCRITNRVAESCLLAKTADFKPRTDLLFIKADGKPYFSNSPTRKLKKMLEAIKADEEFDIDEDVESIILTSHDMRKLCNSILLNQNRMDVYVSKDKVQTLLGHTPDSADTNLAHYTAFTVETLIPLVELLSRIIDNEQGANEEVHNNSSLIDSEKPKNKPKNNPPDSPKTISLSEYRKTKKRA